MAAAPQMYRAVGFSLRDSASYLEWSAGRTAAYPLLLQGVGMLSPSLALLGPLQFGILAAVTCWCTHILEEFARSRIVSATWGLAVILHPQIVSYTQTILPECVFVSTLLVWFGVAMRTIASPTGARAALLGSLLGLLILIKPAAYGFVPAAVVLPLLLPMKRRLRGAVACAAGLFAALLLGVLLTFARTGVFATQNYGGYALIGITGAFVDAEDVPEHASLVANANAEQGPLRTALQRTPSLEVHHFLSAIAYHTVHSTWVSLLERYVLAEGAVAPDSQALFVRLNAIAMEISARAITQHPGAYARHVLTHLYALWMVPFVRSPAQAAAIDQQIDALAKEVSGSLLERPQYRVVPAPVAFAFRMAMATAAIVSILSLMPLAAWRDLASWRMLVFTSVSVNGYYVLVAVAQPGLPRYALMMWPAIVLMLLLACSQIIRWRDTGRAH
jgi:hypothetical protein